MHISACVATDTSLPKSWATEAGDKGFTILSSRLNTSLEDPLMGFLVIAFEMFVIVSELPLSFTGEVDLTSFLLFWVPGTISDTIFVIVCKVAAIQEASTRCELSINDSEVDFNLDAEKLSSKIKNLPHLKILPTHNSNKYKDWKISTS